MANPPPLQLSHTDALNLYELAVLTEDRTDEEHASLLMLARYLDAHAGRSADTVDPCSFVDHAETCTRFREPVR